MGIVAMVLALVAWLGSAVYLWVEAGWIFSVVEVVLIIGGLLTASFLYCSHCPLHKKGCMHGFIGIPARLLTSRCSESYTPGQVVITLGGVAVIVVFPQFWLIKSILVFGVYWVLMIVVAVMILYKVCPQCGNENCAVKKFLKPKSRS